MLEALDKAARSEAPILLRAELGSEVTAFARRAHAQSPRRLRSFLHVRCALIDQLSFGAIAPAAVGTVFLDEVGELPEGLQTRLVHALDRLASEGSQPRLISSTRRNLDEEVTRRRFREQLFFRLNVVDIRIPPLRERQEDILPLASRLIESLSATIGRRPPTLSKDAASLLTQHAFPGNVIELENAIERALLIWPGAVLDAEAFTELTTSDVHARPRVGDDVTLRALEHEHTTRVMARAPNLRRAAEILGIDSATLWRWRQRESRRPDYEKRRRS
jgi:NtrC-family two-component system response regulator AlgB